MNKSCTIIVSHFNSLPFLRTCIRQIRKYKNPLIWQKIIISDQSNAEIGAIVRTEFENEPDIIVVQMQPLYSGFGIDYIMRNVDIGTDYICQLHTDAFPIHKNWLYVPITLMEENDFKFTGVLQFICDKPQSIYPFKNPFIGMAQCFNVGKTEVYKEMALHGGFTRYHNRPQSNMTWLNDDWDKWAKEDYGARGSDDDVPAFYWEDTYREHNKMTFGFTGIMGGKGEANYGSIIEDMVFHFGYHREGLGVMPQMGKKYQNWTKRINENYDDALIEEMLSVARLQKLNPHRIIWNGKEKSVSLPTEAINKRIEELKWKN